ncbi:alpha/beta hydrolase [Agromyces ramosus]|uniref:Phospholipase/carboxylesterase n=1 Tax=Agromyces ramosus TaxID=33879 RepID=A0ABU0R7A8_9MICO|nr:dienelactone hydrolase family protein [Agromyces ramosus]MDQ0893972.1 phospholipase/carboxylesterase [Agromyces ramosus]
MSISIDPEAALWNADPGSRAGRPLLVLMHGRRGDPADRFAMASALPSEFVIVSLRAPIAEEGTWSWFDPARNPSGDPLAEDADQAADAVLRWLDALTFTPSLIGTLGFSQGGAMATHVLRRSERIGFAVNLAGYVVRGEQRSDAVLAERGPPVFWGRGADDPLFDAEITERTAGWLERHTALESHVYEGLDHSTSPHEIEDVAEFLRHRLR